MVRISDRGSCLITVTRVDSGNVKIKLIKMTQNKDFFTFYIFTFHKYIFWPKIIGRKKSLKIIQIFITEEWTLNLCCSCSEISITDPRMYIQKLELVWNYIHTYIRTYVHAYIHDVVDFGDSVGSLQSIVFIHVLEPSSWNSFSQNTDNAKKWPYVNLYLWPFTAWKYMKIQNNFPKTSYKLNLYF
jgi:hypothetical protein